MIDFRVFLSSYWHLWYVFELRWIPPLEQHLHGTDFRAPSKYHPPVLLHTGLCHTVAETLKTKLCSKMGFDDCIDHVEGKHKGECLGAGGESIKNIFRWMQVNKKKKGTISCVNRWHHEQVHLQKWRWLQLDHALWILNCSRINTSVPAGGKHLSIIYRNASSHSRYHVLFLSSPVPSPTSPGRRARRISTAQGNTKKKTATRRKIREKIERQRVQNEEGRKGIHVKQRSTTEGQGW